MTALSEREHLDVMAALDELAERYEDRAATSREEAAYNARHGHAYAAELHEADAVDHQATADRLRDLSERVTAAAGIHLTEVTR